MGILKRMREPRLALLRFAGAAVAVSALVFTGCAVKEIRQEAKKRFNGICRVCPECNGVVCAGEFPGIGGVGTCASFINNYKALAALRVKMRVVHAVGDPETSTTLFSQKLSMPILGAVVAGAKMNFRAIVTEEGLATAFIAAARQAGTLPMTGDGPDPLPYPAGLRVIQDNGGKGIPVTKPRDRASIIAQKVAASMLGMSERQVRRLIKVIREKGDRGIIHGLPGRPSNWRIPEEIRERVLSLYQERYPDFGLTLHHTY